MLYRYKNIYEGGVYHVTQRAPGREMLFIEENDYLAFLSALKERVEKFKLNIFSFCLMPNHYHLLLKIIKANLSEAMHSLNTSYAKEFNLKYKRKGHVFCGVYNAPSVLDDAHLIGSSLYIHLNPQKAGLVRDASEYKWSSVNLYTDNPQLESFVKNDLILGIISDNLKRASAIYKEMLRDYYKASHESIIENPHAVVNFSKAIFKNLTSRLKDRQIKSDFIAGEVKLDEMIENFQKKKRKRRPEDRKAAVYLIEQLKSRGYSQEQMAKILNTSRHTLYRLMDNATSEVQR